MDKDNQVEASATRETSGAMAAAREVNLVRELEMLWDMVKIYALPNDENLAAYKALHAAMIEYTRAESAVQASEGCQNCDALGSAIAQAARKAGIYNGDVPLTGPQLVMLCDDLTIAARVSEVELADLVLENSATCEDCDSVGVWYRTDDPETHFFWCDKHNRMFSTELKAVRLALSIKSAARVQPVAPQENK